MKESKQTKKSNRQCKMIYIHWIWYIVSDDSSRVKPVSERESLGQPPRQLMNMYGSLGRRYIHAGETVPWLRRRHRLGYELGTNYYTLYRVLYVRVWKTSLLPHLYSRSCVVSRFDNLFWWISMCYCDQTTERQLVFTIRRFCVLIPKDIDASVCHLLSVRSGYNTFSSFNWLLAINLHIGMRVKDTG